jgi:penicillin-binding protein 2
VGGLNKKRFIAFLLLSLLFLIVFIVDLMKLQIVDGASFLQKSNLKSYKSVPIGATRGEILDRFGRPLAQNRMGFSIVIDKAFLDTKNENIILYELIKIVEAANEGYSNSTPISLTKPYQYTVGKKDDVKRLLTDLELDANATADQAMTALYKKFDISGIPEADACKVASVRYEMIRRNFSLLSPFTFAQDVSINTVTRVKEHSVDLLGVNITTNPIREYVNGIIAPHVIGSVGPIYAEEYASLKGLGYSYDDIVGKQGIEKAMEEYLRGQDGDRSIEQSRTGVVTQDKVTKEPIPGDTVILTIDERLQEVAQNSLAKVIAQIAQTGKGALASSGACAVVDVRNGEILALATYPSYDLNSYITNYSSLVQNPDKPLFNRAILGVYAPGSAFKLSTALAGLESGAINAKFTVNCTHKYTFFSDYQPTCESWHGTTDLIRALKVSCNFFFFDVSRRTGIKEMNKYGKLLGLGQPTGIELPENTGILAGPDYRNAHDLGVWNPGDTIQAGIGQSDNLFSPLQLANYVATIANGGTRYQAHLVKSVNSYDFNKVIVDDTPKIMDKVPVSKDNWNLIMKGAHGVTEEVGGTAYYIFKNFPIDVGGKTGTAEVPHGTNGIFVGFAPFDKPEIAVAVVVEHGTTGGSTAPVVLDIMKQYFLNKGDTDKPIPEGQLIP